MPAKLASLRWNGGGGGSFGSDFLIQPAASTPTAKPSASVVSKNLLMSFPPRMDQSMSGYQGRRLNSPATPNVFLKLVAELGNRVFYGPGRAVREAANCRSGDDADR